MSFHQGSVMSGEASLNPFKVQDHNCDLSLMQLDMLAITAEACALKAS